MLNNFLNYYRNNINFDDIYNFGLLLKKSNDSNN